VLCKFQISEGLPQIEMTATQRHANRTR